jgi:hypothetical protein
VALRALACLFALSVLTIPGLGFQSFTVVFVAGQSCADPREPMNACRLLEGGYGLFLGVIVVIGLLVQLHRPEQKVAPLQQVGLAAAALGLTAMLGLRWEGLVGFAYIAVAFFVIAALHPLGREAFRLPTDFEPRLLGLAVLAAIPLLIQTLQMTANERARSRPLVEHALAGGWQSEGALALTIALVAMWTAGRASGWRISAWSVAALAFGFGLGSFANPSIPSSAGRLWGGLAMAWALAFAGLSQLVARRTST